VIELGYLYYFTMSLSSLQEAGRVLGKSRPGLESLFFISSPCGALTGIGGQYPAVGSRSRTDGYPGSVGFDRLPIRPPFRPAPLEGAIHNEKPKLRASHYNTETQTGGASNL